MTIELNCTKCEQPLSFANELAGQQAKCPHCGTQLLVPPPHEFLWPPGAAPPKPVSPARPPAPPKPVSPARTPPPAAPPANVPRATATRQSTTAQPPANVPVARATRVSLSGQFSAAKPAAPAGPADPTNQPAPVASPVAAAPSTTPAAGDLSELLSDDEWTPKKPLPPTAETSGSESGRPASAMPRATSTGAPRSVDLKDVLARTWKLYTANLWVLIGTVLLMGLTTVALQWCIRYGVEQSGLQSEDVIATVQSSVPPALRAWAVLLLVFYLPQLLPLPITLGGMSVIATVARNRQASLEDAVVGGAPMLAALVVWLICFIPHSLLTAFCIEQRLAPVWTLTIAGWSWFMLSYLVWFPSLLFISDQCGPIEAIAGSLKFWARNAFALSVLAIASAALFVVSVLPLGLGIPFAAPFILLLFAVAYVRVHPRAS